MIRNRLARNRLAGNRLARNRLARTEHHCDAASRSGSGRTGRGFTLIELMVVVAIIAILAVVALPQLQHYMRIAKAAEVNQMLDVMRKGAAAYYANAHVIKGTTINLPCQFPTSIGITPAGSSCCEDGLDADNDERCDSKPSAWDKPQWSALHFALTNQHYFQYQFDSTGVRDKARFLGSGHADLDCDGVMSTFEIATLGDPKATDNECDAVTGAAVFRYNESE